MYSVIVAAALIAVAAPFAYYDEMNAIPSKRDVHCSYYRQHSPMLVSLGLLLSKMLAMPSHVQVQF